MVDNSQNQFESLSCPLPLPHKDQVVMGHGSGGRMTKELIEKIFYKHFSNALLNAGNDFAVFPTTSTHQNNPRIVVSTDGHVVKPIFFPGGDIGRLAVSGTVNDVSVSGARPLYITASFIIEEGFSIELLENVVISMKRTAEEAGVLIIAGDTKVVEKGSADGVFISTTGIGILDEDYQINGAMAEPGDLVMISGTIGDHGIAVLAARNELGFKTTIQSDVAPLNNLIAEMLRAAPNVHVLRDPTRGGLATTLNEIASQSRVNIDLDEISIPILKPVESACELLGFDPLYVANEGKLVIILPKEQGNQCIDAIRHNPLGKNAQIIGVVTAKSSNPLVTMKTRIGGTRIVDWLSGEMLPRIC